MLWKRLNQCNRGLPFLPITPIMHFWFWLHPSIDPTVQNVEVWPVFLTKCTNLINFQLPITTQYFQLWCCIMFESIWHTPWKSAQKMWKKVLLSLAFNAVPTKSLSIQETSVFSIMRNLCAPSDFFISHLLFLERAVDYSVLLSFDQMKTLRLESYYFHPCLY